MSSNLEMVPSEENYFYFVKILYYFGIPHDKKLYMMGYDMTG